MRGFLFIISAQLLLMTGCYCRYRQPETKFRQCLNFNTKISSSFFPPLLAIVLKLIHSFIQYTFDMHQTDIRSDTDYYYNNSTHFNFHFSPWRQSCIVGKETETKTLLIFTPQHTYPIAAWSRHDCQIQLPHLHLHLFIWQTILSKASYIWGWITTHRF